MENKFTIVQKIDELITSTLDYLKELNTDNFEINFNSAFANLKLAREMRETLVLGELPSELSERMRKINLTAKLIKKEYDNIIRNYSKEIDIIRLEMKNTGNKRKLASYSRGG